MVKTKISFYERLRANHQRRAQMKGNSIKAIIITKTVIHANLQGDCFFHMKAGASENCKDRISTSSSILKNNEKGH